MRGRFEVFVAVAAAAATHQYFLFAVGGNFKQLFTRFRVTGHRTERHFHNDIFTVGSVAACTHTAFARTRINVLAVLEMQQSPQLGIALEDDVPAATTVAPVGPAFLHEFFAAKRHGSAAPVAGAEHNLHIVHKV